MVSEFALRFKIFLCFLFYYFCSTFTEVCSSQIICHFFHSNMHLNTINVYVCIYNIPSITRNMSGCNQCMYIGTVIYSTGTYMRMAGRWILLQYYDNNHWHIFILVDTIWKLHTFIAV